jgi:serine/threonine protein kinase
MISRTTAHYEIVGRLGEGGKGVVYRARDMPLHRTVALQFLSPHVAGDADRKQRLLREVRAASALDPPNIGRIRTVEEADDVGLVARMRARAGLPGSDAAARARRGGGR